MNGIILGRAPMAVLGALALFVAQAVEAKPASTSLHPPVISCGDSSQTAVDIVVCGATPGGAPAGFSLQWQSIADFQSFGWDNPNVCKGSFSGVPKGSSYNLGPGECVTVHVGDILLDQGASLEDPSCNVPLVCGTDYVYRAFAHNVPHGAKKSDFTENLTCKTDPCSSNGPPNECVTCHCTFTQGYWKTHGPIPTGNNTNVWPVTSLTLGTVVYGDLQLLDILNTAPGGNGLLTLAHQLIAAKLNIANGACDTTIATTIAAADALIGGLVIPPIGSGTLTPSQVGSLVNGLTAYNEGASPGGHCGDENTATQ